MAYYLAPALARLRSEVNALWPGRDRSSDGWIGDAAHGARRSDHNPDYAAGGIVRAIDLDEDLTVGGAPFRKAWGLALQIIRDPRVAYVIYEGQIWENPAVYRGRGYWRTYTGSNAHSQHIHVSVRRGTRWDSDPSPWGLARTASTGGSGVNTLPTVPDLTPPTPIEEDPMSALTDDEQRRLLEAADMLRLHFMHVKGRVDASYDMARDTTTRTQIIRAQGDNVTAGVLTLLGRATGADIDESALAAELAPLLVGTLGTLSDADVERVARAVADEQARRLAG